MSEGKGEDRLLRVDQVAQRLNCSKSYVYSLISDGRLKMIPIGRRRGYRVKESSVDDYLSKAIQGFL